MNKTLILVLAVCLVSAHAFVKRDAPATAPADKGLEDIQKQFQDIMNATANALKGTFSEENLKKLLEEAQTQIKKGSDTVSQLLIDEAQKKKE